MKQLCIENLDEPNWGYGTLSRNRRSRSELTGSEEDVPVFWGCGVTPLEAVRRVGLEGFVMAHAPGHMVLLDIEDKDTISK